MINKLNLFKGGERKVDNEPYPLLQGKIFKRMYNIGHLFECIYIRFIRANDLNLNS